MKKYILSSFAWAKASALTIKRIIVLLAFCGTAYAGYCHGVYVGSLGGQTSDGAQFEKLISVIQGPQQFADNKQLIFNRSDPNSFIDLPPARVQTPKLKGK